MSNKELMRKWQTRLAIVIQDTIDDEVSKVVPRYSEEWWEMRKGAEFVTDLMGAISDFTERKKK